MSNPLSSRPSRRDEQRPTDFRGEARPLDCQHADQTSNNTHDLHHAYPQVNRTWPPPMSGGSSTSPASTSPHQGILYHRHSEPDVTHSYQQQHGVSIPADRMAEWRHKIQRTRAYPSEPILQPSQTYSNYQDQRVLPSMPSTGETRWPRPSPPPAVNNWNSFGPESISIASLPKAQYASTNPVETACKAEHLEPLSDMTDEEKQKILAEEEVRMLDEALKASTLESQQAEHERTKLMAQEMAQLELALDHSRRDKGKGAETDEQKREREELETAMALSLEESRRRPSAVTSAQMFEMLSKPSRQDQDNSTQGETSAPVHNVATESTENVERGGSASDRLPWPQQTASYLSPSVQPRFVFPEHAPEMDEPEDIVIGPGRPVPAFLPSNPSSRQSTIDDEQNLVPVGSPANLSASSSQSSLLQQFEHDPTRASFMSTASVAGSFESESYIDTAHQMASTEVLRRQITTSADQRCDPHDGVMHGQDPFADPHTSTDLFGRAGVMRSDSRLRGPRQPYERALPSPDGLGAVYEGPRAPGSTDGSSLVVTKSLPSIALTSVSSSSDDTASTTTRLSPTTPTPIDQAAASPSFGGFIETASDNVLADERVLSGVTWGFVEPTRAQTHLPLEHEGDFPRAAQLSRERHDGDRMPFGAFAVEASTWQSLLVYLMWHGHSRFEAAPSDMQSEKSGRGLAVDITVDFFRSFQDENPRVRCQLDLLPPGVTEKQPEDGCGIKRPNTFDNECPFVSIRITDPVGPYLPVPLSKVAQMLSQAHTRSRAALKQTSSWRSATVASAAAAAASSSSSASALPSSGAILAQQRELALAIDLFNKLAIQLDTGINYDSRARTTVDEVETERETSMMRNLKARLKNKIRKGKATGSHALSHVKPSSSSSLSTEYHQSLTSNETVGSASGERDKGKGRRKVVELSLVQPSVDRRNDLPEGARLITPFRLDEAD
ncbi:hypothetical protein OIV83_001590 [Microbotryomycetes sp. JL201]|nr:hypothetical protein OIV83_001590 [Microbotryomycetes sp. JL201]